MTSALDKLYDIDFENYYDLYYVAPAVAATQLQNRELDAVVTLPPYDQSLSVHDDFEIIAHGGDLYREARTASSPSPSVAYELTS